MNDTGTAVMTAENELLEVLLDFIVVSAMLAKKLSCVEKTKSINEGGKANEQSREFGYGHQRFANRGFSN